jgi:hypothetical protein
VARDAQGGAMKTKFEYTGGPDTFFNAYLECALWSSMDDTDEPLDATYGIDDIESDTLEAMLSECRDFCDANCVLLADLDAAQAGHDFWLTRNGHGAGFWDRGLGAIGDALTLAAHNSGERDLYVTDAGRIAQA